MGKIRTCLDSTVYLWIFGIFLLYSVSALPSLWGKKVDFLSRPCHWQLSKNSSLPSLKELTVCVDLLRWIPTSDWTVFVYKKPEDHNIELGLAGSGGNLKAWIFGKELVIAQNLPLYRWHTVCLTWSNHTRKFQLIINGTVQHITELNNLLPSSLAPNGTLTLGVSHSIIGGVMDIETGTNFAGEITLFRMWGEELSPWQLVNLKCSSGNIMTWSMTDWEFYSCLPMNDFNLNCECSMYKIHMTLSFTHNINIKKAGKLNANVFTVITRKWLKSIFPEDVSLHYVFLKIIGQPYTEGNQHNEKKERSLSLSISERFSCLVYVTVSPAVAVDKTQALLWTLLLPVYNYSIYTTLQADPASINILPVASIPENSKNSTASDMFFKIFMNLTMNGTMEDAPQILHQWILQTLGGVHKMKVFNFRLIETHKYRCTFHVQTPASVYADETAEVIFGLLKKGFTNASITIVVLYDQISILHIEPGFCPDDTTLTVFGHYTWLSMPAENTHEIRCERGHNTAIRLCKLDDTDAAIWDPPDVSRCEKVTNIGDLEDIIVTPNNSADVVDMIQTLVQNQTDLNSFELNIVLQKLSEVTHIANMTTYLGNDVINVVSDLFKCTSLPESTNEILLVTERVGDRMVFSGNLYNTSAPSLALQLINQESQLFQGLTFGISSFQTGLPPEIFFSPEFNEQSASGFVASISLPIALETFLPQNNGGMSRIQFQFFGAENLFQDQNASLVLNSYVVSASVTNTNVTNLSDPVVFTLLHFQPKGDQDTIQCVYWNMKKNGGRGGWDGNGCQVKHSNSTHTSCDCFHLTHFGVLLDVFKTPTSPKDDMVLTIITNLGCGLSAIFLGITLMTYMAFEKLRRDYPAKILINLSGALLGLNMLFLINSWFASFNNYGLCITVAAILHYFLLATFTWMGLEGINMYLAFVKVFNVYVPSYILKFCAIGWGLPLMIVAVVLATDKDNYGATFSITEAENSTSFCWVQNETTFYVTVVAYIVLILLCNISVFGMVLVQIRGMSVSKEPGTCNRVLHDLRVIASLTFLLGLTWMLVFFTWGPLRVFFLYLFSLLNSMQGFFIFLFHCLLKENVHKQWRIHLCCGQFKLTDYSDWSGSLTLGGKARSEKLAHTPPDMTNQQKISRSN